MYCFLRWDHQTSSQYNMCSIKLWAKDYPHAGYFRCLTYNRIQHCLANVLQLLCTNFVFFHQPNLTKKYSVHVCLVLKTCLPLLVDVVCPAICKIYTSADETNVHNYNMLMTSLCRFEMHEFLTIVPNTTSYNQCLPLTASSYRPYCEFSSILFW